MDYSPVLKDLAHKCSQCHIGQAVRALEIIQQEMGTPAEAADLPVPAKPEPIRSKRAKPKRTVSNRSNTSRSVSGRGMKNANERSADGKEKRCHKCGDMKLLGEYPEHKQCRDGHTGICNQCSWEIAKKNYRARQKRKGPLTDKDDHKAASTSAQAKPEGKHCCRFCEDEFRSLDTLDTHIKIRHGGER